MNRRKFLAGSSALILGGCTSATQKSHRRQIKWRMVTAWPAVTPVLQKCSELFAHLVADLSEGQLIIRVFAANELIQTDNLLEAASQNEIQCYHASSYYWPNDTPAAQWFSSVPFGLNTEGCLAWILSGNGLDLWEETYAPLGVVPYPMGATGMQMGGWFKNRVDTLDDLASVIIRIPGLAGRIYERLGATVKEIPAGEIFSSFRSGDINAADWIGPYLDTRMGLAQLASNYYYPGWQEPAGVLELGINQKAFDALPQHLKGVIRASAQQVTQIMLADMAKLNADALHRLHNNESINILPFPKPVMNAFLRTADDVLEEEAGRTPMCRKVHEDYKAFLARWLEWGRIASMGYFDLMR